MRAPKAESDSVHLGPLVCFRNWSNYCAPRDESEIKLRNFAQSQFRVPSRRTFCGQQHRGLHPESPHPAILNCLCSGLLESPRGVGIYSSHQVSY
jgi:hypothetical protein